MKVSCVWFIYGQNDAATVVDIMVRKVLVGPAVLFSRTNNQMPKFVVDRKLRKIPNREQHSRREINGDRQKLMMR